MTVAIVNHKQAQGVGLPALLERASNALASARTSGEVLEARDLASVAYDAAKSAGRMARAKNAHDEIIGAVYRAQADAALIEARAKVRLADEYDAAQDRGEVAKLGTNQRSDEGVTNGNTLPTAADIGLTRKEIHDARTLRDAEIADPGVIERAVTESVSAGKEPTKAVIKRAALKATGKEETQPQSADTATLQAQVASLQEALNDALDTNSELAIEVEAKTINESDSRETEIAQLLRQIEVLKSQNAQYMTKNNELIKQVQNLQRALDKVKGERNAA